MTTYEGKPVGGDGRYAVVVARFNQSITERLLSGAVETLVSHGVAAENIDVAWEPGAFEIPTVASRIASAGRHVAIMCLGAVIRGQTTHDQYINRSVSMALAQLGTQYKMPVIFGVLTCETLDQAIARSGGRVATTGKDDVQAHLGNKGVDCALAALEMVDLLNKLPKA